MISRPIRSYQIAGANRHTVRGKIIAHITKQTGWWIFKTTHPGVFVSLDPEGLKACGKVQFQEGPSQEISRMIEIYITEDLVMDFPIGVDVDVTFAMSGAIQQFFQGHAPILVIGLVRAGTKAPVEMVPLASATA